MTVTVAVDANGADLGPAEVAAGAALAAARGVRVKLYGPVEQAGDPAPGVELIDAPLSVSKDPDPARAVRANPEASISRAASATFPRARARVCACHQALHAPIRACTRSVPCACVPVFPHPLTLHPGILAIESSADDPEALPPAICFEDAAGHRIAFAALPVRDFGVLHAWPLSRPPVTNSRPPFTKGAAVPVTRIFLQTPLFNYVAAMAAGL